MKLRELAGRAALVLAGAAVALGAGEILVRITGAAPEVVLIASGRYRLSKNPRIGYEPIPRLIYDGKNMDLFDYRGPSNSLGFRDRDHALAKPPGTFRIEVLGDSIGSGLYVDRYEDTFPSLIESDLRKKGIPVEVINLSVSGYDTEQEVETFREKGLAYHPDLVLVAYCLNDRTHVDGGIMSRLLSEREHKGGIPSSVIVRRWLVRSALYRFLRYRVFPPRVPGPGGSARRLDEDTRKAAFDELDDLTRNRGIKVVVVVFPELSDLTDYVYMRDHRAVRRFADEHHFDYLDLLDPFRYCEAIEDGEIGVDRYHPTVAGHHCAAGVIEDFLVERHLVPAPAPSKASPASS